MILRLIIGSLALVSLGACRSDETVSAYGGAEKTWRLVTLEDQTFEPVATLRFLDDGAIAGTGPCNVFGGTQTAPYPSFKLEKLASTKRACPDLMQETRYFDALQDMTQSEVQGDTLILSTDSGREMLFKAAP